MLDSLSRGSILYRMAVLSRGEWSVFKSLRGLRLLEATASPADILQRQEGALRRTLMQAWANCPWYRENCQRSPQTDEDIFEYLRDLPILEKRDLQEHQSEILCRNRRGPTRTKTTGGSTGAAVTVQKNSGAIAKEMAASWLCYGWFGVRIGDRGARFWGTPSKDRRRLRFMAADLAMNRIKFSAFAFTTSDLERYWQRAVRFRPAYFYGYVSMITEFSRFLVQTGRDGRPLRLKAVVTTSEVLSDSDRGLISETFGCPVQNEYGCGEVGPVAYSCPSGGLHIMSENIFLEVVDESGAPCPYGSPGQLLITDLNNAAMPLIRYRVGDYAEMSAAQCPCGRPFPLLNRIWGRAYDFVTGLDGRRFHGEFFMYLFEEMREEGMGVEQFQVVQSSPGVIEFRLLNSEIKAEQIAFIRSRCDEHLPGMTFTFSPVRELSRAPSGKMRLIINENLAGPD